MTTSEFLNQYWPLFAVLLGVLLLVLVVLRRGRRQRVSLTEQDSSTRTLARPEATPPAAAPAPMLADSELTRLKGVGPKLAAALDAAGVGSLDTLAALDDGEQAALDARLGTFAGRVQRDRLVEQARLLTSDPAAYEAMFGKGA